MLLLYGSRNRRTARTRKLLARVSPLCSACKQLRSYHHICATTKPRLPSTSRDWAFGFSVLLARFRATSASARLPARRLPHEWRKLPDSAAPGCRVEEHAAEDSIRRGRQLYAHVPRGRAPTYHRGTGAGEAPSHMRRKEKKRDGGGSKEPSYSGRA
jgi:hypothetical protein